MRINDAAHWRRCMTTPTLCVRTETGAGGGPVETVIGPESSCSIGRAIDADVMTDDVLVSRRHLPIEPAAPGWLIRDVSTNGSWYIGVRIDPAGLWVAQAGS